VITAGVELHNGMASKAVTPALLFSERLKDSISSLFTISVMCRLLATHARHCVTIRTSTAIAVNVIWEDKSGAYWVVAIYFVRCSMLNSLEVEAFSKRRTEDSTN